jgi:hypothetical protein
VVGTGLLVEPVALNEEEKTRSLLLSEKEGKREVEMTSQARVFPRLSAMALAEGKMFICANFAP